MIRKLWAVMRRPSTRWGLGTLVLGGALVGAVGWNGFHYAVEATTTTEFCLSCHSMQGNFEEYKTTVHYSNPMGVRAECADCHVPKSGWRLYRAKVLAAKDLWGEITGSIDTPEKFEAHRLEMAETVWADMKANDSIGCRSCHSFEAMDFAHQTKPDAATQMQKAMQEGGTCIDCHKGIAHHLPDMSSGYKKLFEDLEAAAGALRPKPGDMVYPLKTLEVYLEQPSGDGGKASGKVLAATPMKVEAAKGDWLRVSVEGWQQEGAERMLYAAQGQRIFNLALTPAALGAVVPGTSMVDPDTEQTWTDATISVWVKNADLTDSLDKVWSYAGSMFNAACGTCHVLPQTGHFLANQWIGTLNAMKPKAPLDEEQFRLVQKYVQMHAKDMGGEEHE
ncbi:pentaheme c-type cytochrome TorC [Rhodobacter maris]|uniref:Cytochrome c-type protein n=1 Tax=Rhodobacter maris TaxID=446682 RepID=A0A285SM55_9RHOB|nr:pentaheme c-type cytochrome TorC [Rhodobacter maris]SOC09097.1 trimethylamine-N-oxide reductase cytochrome c-type subunit TorC [Rhodobacter maris]